ncbi:hypothetical protein HMI54_015319 [Coelomomyces lativittatus]|nr:hypothetical protein HMI54_015319 [Coelomomyces lativittatus]
MMGPDIEDEVYKGIIPRITEQIFQCIYSAPTHIEFTVQCSFMEIYMEKIRDLLAPHNDNLPIHEEKSRGVYVKGLKEVYVSTIPEVYQAMHQGLQSRVVAFTNMNTESSRSHSIFVITIQQKNVADGSHRTGKLSLVDLAGSEKVGKTGASGQTLEEAKKINKSLAALGMVINALTDGKSTHVPYRDSKLTRILQESLGGNAQTTLIINCSPSAFNEPETLSTLRFGMRAKSIKNKVTINQELSSTELKLLLKKAESQLAHYKKYIPLLEAELSLWRQGQVVNPEQYAHLEKIKLDEKRPDSTGTLTMVNSRPASPSDLEDEKDEFLKRENQLMDDLSEREKELEQTKLVIDQIQSQLQGLQEKELQWVKERMDLVQQLQVLKVDHEKDSSVNRDIQMQLEVYSDQVKMLEVNVLDLQQQCMDLAVNEKEKCMELEKEKKKSEKLAFLLAQSTSRGSLRHEDLAQLTAMTKANTTFEKDPSLSKPQENDTVSDPVQEDTLEIANDITPSLSSLRLENQRLIEKQKAMEAALLQLQKESDQTKHPTLTSSTSTSIPPDQNLSSPLEQEASSSSFNANLDVASEITTKVEDVESVQPVENESNDPITHLKKMFQAQLKELDQSRKSLMRDLQNRCEKVVELEVSLDDLKEQHHQLLASTTLKTTQTKLSILERNLDQLTHVQSQLVDQNFKLKKEMALAERKLSLKDESIKSLEKLLNDTQLEFGHEKEKFEADMASLLQQVNQLTSSLSKGPSMSNMSPLDIGGRIAKPLRGGGGGNGSEAISIKNEKQESDPNPVTPSKTATSSKKLSWLGF